MRFEITMQNTIGMTASNSRNDLPQKGADRRDRQSYSFRNVITLLELIHVGFQIMSHVFKHEIEAARVGLDDIQQTDL